VLSVRTLPPDTEAPGSPANLRSPAQTGTTIELAWDASTDDVGVTGYRVQGPGGTTEVAGTSHVESDLAPRSTYAFQVSAVDAAGNESQPCPVLSVETGEAEPVSLRIALAADADDAEEAIATGSVQLDSGDLELGEESGGPQLVGLRFAGVSIPQGATILQASLQFTCDEAGTGDASLVVRGEASGDAAPFSTASFDLSSRPATGAASSWNPDPWTLVGEAGAGQHLDGLGAVLQEIAGRPDWSSGNSLVLLISGSGRRTAESRDGSPAAAAELSVDYVLGSDPPPEPPPSGGPPARGRRRR
jgi:hypothetical protein